MCQDPHGRLTNHTDATGWPECQICLTCATVDRLVPSRRPPATVQERVPEFVISRHVQIRERCRHPVRQTDQPGNPHPTGVDITGHPNTIATAFENVAQLAIAEHQPDRAVELFGASARLKMEIGAANAPRFGPRIEAIIASLRGELGAEQYSDAWERGVSMTTEEAVSSCIGPNSHRS